MNKVVEYLSSEDGPPDVLTSDGDVTPPWYVESDLGHDGDAVPPERIEVDSSACIGKIGHSAAAELVSGRLSLKDMYPLAKEYEQAAGEESKASPRRTKRSDRLREKARAIRTEVDDKIAELLGIRNDKEDPGYIDLIWWRKYIRENYKQIIKDYEKHHSESTASGYEKPWEGSDHAERASGAYFDQ